MHAVQGNFLSVSDLDGIRHKMWKHIGSESLRARWFSFLCRMLMGSDTKHGQEAHLGLTIFVSDVDGIRHKISGNTTCFDFCVGC